MGWLWCDAGQPSVHMHVLAGHRSSQTEMHADVDWNFKWNFRRYCRIPAVSAYSSPNVNLRLFNFVSRALITKFRPQSLWIHNHAFMNYWFNKCADLNYLRVHIADRDRHRFYHNAKTFLYEIVYEISFWLSRCIISDYINVGAQNLLHFAHRCAITRLQSL